jgi:hypothetical protein
MVLREFVESQTIKQKYIGLKKSNFYLTYLTLPKLIKHIDLSS